MTEPLDIDIVQLARSNDAFRREVATGEHSQIVAMTIPAGGEIGEEVHEENDQLLVFIDGEGDAVLDGKTSKVTPNDLVMVPAGTRHNFINTGDGPLRLVTVYAPPEHPPGTVHLTKEEAEAAEGHGRPKGDAMRVLLIGPPGAGKGTQAIRIADHFDLAWIATGNLLREQVANGTELGQVAKEYMDKGDLVPDDLEIEMTTERMAQAAEEGGYVLDGYPRTLAQAEAAYRWAVAKGIPFDLTLYFEIEEAELLARLAGRAREEHRSDDTEETVRHRLEVFAAQTRPLVDYYQRRGILLRINAVGPIDAISEQIFANLHWHKARAMAAGANRPEWAIDD